MSDTEKLQRARDLIRCLVENDPAELAADGGITVLDVWRKDAERFLVESADDEN